jgi:hypothetical protein
MAGSHNEDMSTTAPHTTTTTLNWAAQVGTRRPRFFATREEAEAFLNSTGKAGWVGPACLAR